MRNKSTVNVFNKILEAGAITAAALLLLWACAPKITVSPVPEGVRPEEELFLRAEELFQAELYGDALETYKRYLAKYPAGQHAPETLIRIGAIHTASADYQKAQDAYQRLLAEYPDSTFVGQAKVGILATFYNLGQYEEVIQLASTVLEEKVSRDLVVRTYTILGDTYVAQEAPEDAVYFYTMAHKKAVAEGQDVLVDKLKEAISRLDAATLESLLGYVQEDLPRGYLLYQLGFTYSADEQFDEAIRALSEFIKHYPEHEKVQHAKSLMEQISEKFVYRRTAIGCLLPLSGPYRRYGNRALKGIELAFAQFSAKGFDPSVSLVIKDTGGDPDKARAAVRELIDEQVAAIIGPMVTAESAAEIAQDYGLPIITITQKDNITEIGDYVFRNFLTPRLQVQTLVSFATEKLGVRTFAILYPNEKYGTTFMNLFWDEVLKYGGTVVGVEAYNPSHTDFAGPIKKLVGLYYNVPPDLKEIMASLGGDETENLEESRNDDNGMDDNGVDREEKDEEEPLAIVDFEAVFIPDAPKMSGLIIPQLAFYDVENVYLLGTNLWHSNKLIEMAKDYVQGAVMTDGFFAESSSRRVSDFVKSFNAFYAEKPGFIEATTYDTALMLFEIVTRPDIRSRSAIKKELLGLRNYEGVTGLTAFDPNGDVRKQLRLLHIEGKRFLELEPY
ncbi:MAG: penicillin-binding protein activator [Desulfobacterales bacterium]|jgi:ABC-type branched-subunit amino acid transport system substrate-binding protein